jgi:gamma-glutamylcyclotransferase (GGCT)/AIG2-like uncharacterized protein YtfP
MNKQKKNSLIFLNSAWRRCIIAALRKIIPDKGMEKVFVYATLLDKKARKKLLGRDVEYHVDKLIGYREVNIESNEGPNYHTLLPDETDSVLGKRFLVTLDELRKLDGWEDEYIRKKMQLVSGHVAWVYFLKVQNMADKGHNLDIPN